MPACILPHSDRAPIEFGPRGAHCADLRRFVGRPASLSGACCGACQARAPAGGGHFGDLSPACAGSGFSFLPDTRGDDRNRQRRVDPSCVQWAQRRGIHYPPVDLAGPAHRLCRHARSHGRRGSAYRASAYLCHAAGCGNAQHSVDLNATGADGHAFCE